MPSSPPTSCCDTGHEEHPSHHAELAKLNRVTGQVEGIRKMIEEQRYCPDIMIQLRAVRAALKTIEAGILERHLHHCVSKAMINPGAAETENVIRELGDIFKRFDE